VQLVDQVQFFVPEIVDVTPDLFKLFDGIIHTYSCTDVAAMCHVNLC